MKLEFWNYPSVVLKRMPNPAALINRLRKITHHFIKKIIIKLQGSV